MRGCCKKRSGYRNYFLTTTLNHVEMLLLINPKHCTEKNPVVFFRPVCPKAEILSRQKSDRRKMLKKFNFTACFY